MAETSPTACCVADGCAFGSTAIERRAEDGGVTASSSGAAVWGVDGVAASATGPRTLFNPTGAVTGLGNRPCCRGADGSVSASEPPESGGTITSVSVASVAGVIEFTVCAPGLPAEGRAGSAKGAGSAGAISSEPAGAFASTACVGNASEAGSTKPETASSTGPVPALADSGSTASAKSVGAERALSDNQTSADTEGAMLSDAGALGSGGGCRAATGWPVAGSGAAIGISGTVGGISTTGGLNDRARSLAEISSCDWLDGFRSRGAFRVREAASTNRSIRRDARTGSGAASEATGARSGGTSVAASSLSGGKGSGLSDRGCSSGCEQPQPSNAVPAHTVPSPRIANRRFTALRS